MYLVCYTYKVYSMIEPCKYEYHECYLLPGNYPSTISLKYTALRLMKQGGLFLCMLPIIKISDLKL